MATTISSAHARPFDDTTVKAKNPAWVLSALLGLLGLTAVLYLWSLGASGWANTFYSAAVQAGSDSWKAFFFGSSDAANAITVDKPPASLWVMALSVRIFGLSSWSILVPQALMGVATVGVLYATVRRWFSPSAALLSGLVMALTPVAALMFRFNNPDALLVLLLTIGAYATVRAIEKAASRAGTWWLVLAASLVGFGFLTKMLQALLVVPVFALAYLIAAPVPVKRRIFQLLMAGVGLVVSAGWWIAIVELVPASMRPYVGGSQTNSILELTLGYNGLGRITGNEVGSVGGGGGQGGGQGGGWGETGWTRMFNSEMGGQIAWLLPAALIFLFVILWITRRRPRTDRTRSAFVLWGGWLLVTGLIFSFMQGIFHQYYTVALAPAIAALVGMGAVELWKVRQFSLASLTLAGTTGLTAVWSYLLLDRTPDWYPWLKWVVLIVGIAAAIGILAVDKLSLRIAHAIGGAALVAVLLGPASYTLDTIMTPHQGSIVTAGPSGGGRGGMGGGPGGMGGGPGGMGGGPGGMPGGQNGTGQNGTGQAPNGTGQNGTGQNGTGQNGTGQNGTGQNGTGQNGTGQNGTGQNGTGQNGTGQDGGGQGGPGGGGGGGMGGLLSGSSSSSAMTNLLKANASSYTWVAAAIGANNASGYQLASEEPVMAIGGFNGSDPSPTLEQFKQYVAEGKVHYFIGGGDGMGGGRGGPGGGTSSEISTWVQENFEATTVDGTTVYDLTAGKTTGSST